MMKCIAQSSDWLMLVKDDVPIPVDISEKRLVFDLSEMELKKTIFPVGSWLAHCPGWEDPKEDYDVDELFKNFDMEPLKSLF